MGLLEIILVLGIFLALLFLPGWWLKRKRTKSQAESGTTTPRAS